MTTSADLAGAIVAALAGAGTRLVFGVPGGGPNLDVVGAAAAAGLRFVLARGETAYPSNYDRLALEHLATVVKRARLRSRALASLTAREQEIIPLLADGLSNRQCARQLGISVRTLESHIGRIYRKLDVHSRMEAVGRAMAIGLLETEKRPRARQVVPDRT